VLLADEPTGNLDGRTAQAIVERLSSLSATRGVAILLVTHNPAVAAYAHRIVRLEEGRLVGEPQPAAHGAQPMVGRA
jgi:ABC-type lipoprotein export system ATPase subunit